MSFSVSIIALSSAKSLWLQKLLRLTTRLTRSIYWGEIIRDRDMTNP
ncbi:MAG: hypothetical protein RID53_23630 [Coleofasciculus sp. B1-GNL1-01]